MKGRPKANGICRCGHPWGAHGYIGADHWCSGGVGSESNRRPTPCPCVRYVRDRRKAIQP